MRTSTRRRLAAVTTALGLAAALAACSSEGDRAAAPGTGTTSSTDERPSQAGEHNEADAQFAQMMIVHHEGAIEMAELALDRAASPEVTALAGRIAAAQGPEIELMTGWLEAWGEELPGAMDMGGMDHGGMDMDGMDQDEAMGALDELDGADFDRRFLELMTAHHEGAVEMSEVELKDGTHPDALELARAIIDAQTAEIAEMQDLLAGL